LVEQEEITKKLSKESRKLKCDFNLAQAANVDLEKKSRKMGRGLPKKPLKIQGKNLKSYRRLMMRI
jgi:hypothetical protein